MRRWCCTNVALDILWNAHHNLPRMSHLLSLPFLGCHKCISLFCLQISWHPRGRLTAHSLITSWNTSFCRCLSFSSIQEIRLFDSTLHMWTPKSHFFAHFEQLKWHLHDSCIETQLWMKQSGLCRQTDRQTDTPSFLLPLPFGDAQPPLMIYWVSAVEQQQWRLGELGG